MTAPTQDRPGAIDARPVRHPGRWVAVVLIAIVVAMIISSFVTNEQLELPVRVRDHAADPRHRGPVEGHDLRHRRGDGRSASGSASSSRSCGCPPTPCCAASRSSTRGSSARSPATSCSCCSARASASSTPPSTSACPSGSRSPTSWASTPALTFFTLDYNSISSTIWVGILGLGPLRGRVHGRDRAGRHPLGRQGPVRGRPGARHAAGQDDAPGRAPPGDAGHRAADRQRDDRHGQGHLAARGGARHRRALLPELPVRPAQLPDHARHRRGDDLVPHRLLDPHGRPVPPGALLRPRLRRRCRRRPSTSSPRSGPTTDGADRRTEHDRRRPALVHAVNVTKAFHGTEVLKGIDMDVRRGEVVVLLGPSGLGQDDVPALHQPARDDRRRPHLGRRRPHGLRGPRRHAAPPQRQARSPPSAATSACASSGSTSSPT